jgi:hypothetical protein
VTPRSVTGNRSEPYFGSLIAVGTSHGKQHQFAPAFTAVLGARLVTPPALDTDQFGTFTGETPRSGPPAQAALAKARLAMTLLDVPRGLASEASYGPLPGGWYGHQEILLFIDTELGIEVIEGHRTMSVPGLAHRVSQAADLPGPLLAGLPGQALIVRPSEPSVPDRAAVTKGITDVATARSAITAAAARSPDGLAVVEPDLRAHHNPSRRRVLAALAARLAHRLATRCPACAAPGFGRVDAQPGLPCRVCATPTPLVGNEIHACAVCSHQQDHPVRDGADPASCPACNP